MKRTEFLRIAAAAGLGACLPNANAAILPWLSGDRDMSFGWTTCLTYETVDRKLGFDYFNRLLDEMHANGMDRLLVMMASHGYYAPKNHGLAWPVKDEKLKLQLDKNAINAYDDTEFFSRIIYKAHDLGIKIFIEIKYLGMIGIKQGYPGVEFRRNKSGGITHTIRPQAGEYEREAIETLHICCDNPPAHQYMRDKITDVLSRYRDLDGIVLEHPSYSGSTCYCQDSRDRVLQDTGREIGVLSLQELREWKSVRIRDTLIDLRKLVKAINPDFQYGFYTGFSPADRDIAGFQANRGHQIETLQQVGFDFLMPYCEGRHEALETFEIQRVIEYLDPMEIYLHTTIRREPPHNYKLPPKGPEYIRNMIEWGIAYQNKNPRFKGMTFFNEVKLPVENRQAVYDNINL
jgi:hypothetical protein